MYPAVQQALNNDHIAELRSMSSTARHSHPTTRGALGRVRNAAGWKLIGIGMRIAVRPPLSPAGR
jgi:hypothetical protein